MSLRRLSLLHSLLIGVVLFLACGPEKAANPPGPAVSVGTGGRSGGTGGAPGNVDAAVDAVQPAPSDVAVEAGDSGDAADVALEVGPSDARADAEVAPPVSNKPDAEPDPDYSSMVPRCYLQAIVRDFSATAPTRHPDFQHGGYWGNDVCKGLVAPALGAEGLYVSPVSNMLVPSMTCPGVSTARPQFTQMADWYKNLPGVNYVFDVQIPLYDTGRGTVAYKNSKFFPVDGKGWNDMLNAADKTAHNFGFTTHVLRHFTYKKGQSFRFTGDDDVWVFVEGKQVIDLGGLHPARSQTANLDEITPPLVEGLTYRLDLFHAERRTDASGFEIETSICDVFGTDVFPGPGGSGGSDGGAGDGGAGDAGVVDAGTDAQPAGPPVCYMQAIIRDFRASGPNRHPDFEEPMATGGGVCKGMLEPNLTLVNQLYATPVMKMLAAKPCMTNGTWPQIRRFGDWYQNNPEINRVFDVQIPLYATGNGTVKFGSDNFYPVDGKGFDDKLMGRDGKLHNFGFTTHVLRHFTYKKGQTFTFSGDDDAWVFVEGKLVMDLGGLHAKATDTVVMDNLGLTEGQTYRLDFFHAERHTLSSSFQIETSICDTLPAKTP